MDAAGDVFVSNNTGVAKITAGGVQSTVPATDIGSIYDVAVDGAGDVFLADFTNNRVVEVTPSGVQTTVPATGLNTPTGVAVDGAGDVFITDLNNNRVVKVTPSGVQTTVPTSGVIRPYYPAVDGAGDVFFLDSGNERVLKVTPGGIQSTIPTSGLGSGNGVAVDAAGDVFITDQINNVVLEVTPTGVQTTVPTSGMYIPAGLAVDAAGDVFIADNGQGLVYELNLSQPVVNLGVVSQNYQSSDTPLSLQNVGNQTLTGSVGTVTGAGISEDAGASTCTSFTLAPGASCVENFYANTPSVGSISATVVVTDNALNGAPATQTINLSALSIGPAVSFNVTVGGTGTGFVESSPTGIDCGTGGSPGTCSASFSTGLAISLEEVPTGGSTFAGWGGACASAGASQFCTVNITTATTVTANFTSTAASNLTVSDIGSGSGTVTSGDGNIGCVDTNGVVTGSPSCSANYSSGTVTLTASASAGSAFLGWGGACAISGTSPTCTVSMIAAINVTASFSLQSFGSNVNVCPSDETIKSVSPCSSTQTVTFNLAATTTIGAIQVVTQGVTGLDFALGTGSTCSGTITAGNSCNVNVNFTPLAPGLRMGAVELYDNNGNLVASTPIYGIALGPEAAFNPGTQTTVNTGVSALATPNGVAVDAAGDVYIAVAGDGQVGGGAEVLRVAPGGAVSSVGSGLAYPQGLAVDGAGDVFIADNDQNEVFEVTPAGVQTAMNFGLTAQLGVAVDGAGNLFVSDFNAAEVIEAPPGCTTNLCSTVVYTAPSGFAPVGLAVDAAGDLFVADFTYTPPGMIVELPVGCRSACQTTVGTGWSAPEAVAVDAAGDVFVADEAPKVVEVPAGCINNSACQITVSQVLAYGVAVDAKGNIFIPDRGTGTYSDQVLEINRSLPPSLSFALTNVGGSNGPQPVTVQNIGNQSLSVSVGATSTTSFIETQQVPRAAQPRLRCWRQEQFALKASASRRRASAFSTIRLVSAITL